MKINRLVSAIFFFVVGLFSLASLQAQEAKTLFVNIPCLLYTSDAADE